jgi:site-specific DNA-methyltransferase (adenine-specific)
MFNLQSKGHRGVGILYLGDCLEVMKRLDDKSIDMILADIPYGTTSCKWDTIIPLEPMWENLNRICSGAIVLFCSEPFTFTLGSSNLKNFRHAYSWIKTKASNFQHARKMPMKRHENILVFGDYKFYLDLKPIEPIKQSRKNKGANLHGARIKDSGDYFQTETGFKFSDLHFANPSGKGQFHPTQKPVPLLEYLIQTYSQEGDTVLDFTMGSGSTGVACKNLNREFIGIEKDEKYFEIANKRINER